MAKRIRFTPEFKAKVTLESLSGEMTLAALSSKYDMHPNMAAVWKRQANEDMADTFVRARQRPKTAKRKSRRCTPSEARSRWKTIFTSGLRSEVDSERRRRMVEADRPRLSITRPCELLGLRRSTDYYQLKSKSAFNLALMRLIDETFFMAPFFGSRQMTRHLANCGYMVGRRRIKRLMRKMGLQAVFCRFKTPQPHPAHTVYPYLLRNVSVTARLDLVC